MQILKHTFVKQHICKRSKNNNAKCNVSIMCIVVKNELDKNTQCYFKFGTKNLNLKLLLLLL
jgi:hypothetical protein